MVTARIWEHESHLGGGRYKEETWNTTVWELRGGVCSDKLCLPPIFAFDWFPREKHHHQNSVSYDLSVHPLKCLILQPNQEISWVSKFIIE